MDAPRWTYSRVCVANQCCSRGRFTKTHTGRIRRLCNAWPSPPSRIWKRPPETGSSMGQASSTFCVPWGRWRPPYMPGTITCLHPRAPALNLTLSHPSMINYRILVTALMAVTNREAHGQRRVLTGRRLSLDARWLTGGVQGTWGRPSACKILVAMGSTSSAPTRGCVELL